MPASPVDSLLRSLVAAYGPPGRETGIRSALKRAVRGLGRVSEDASGNLHLRVPGKGPRLLLVAHMDAPGIIVTRVEESGVGRLSLLGGTPVADWIGATVVFPDDTRGWIGWDRPKSDKDGAAPEPEQLFLETGFDAKAAKRRISVGAVGAMDDRLERLGDLWSAANLDDRAGCAAVAAAVRSARRPRFDLHVVFSAQSDLGARGAATGAFGIDPDVAVVVDLAPASEGKGGVLLGKGPCLGLKEEGYLAHPAALDLVKRAARAGGVATQWLIRDEGGSDARTIRAARSGVPTALVAVPSRAIGGPRKLIHARDLSMAAKLLTHLLRTPYTPEAR
jgi:tetrahedral aminopeptidase